MTAAVDSATGDLFQQYELLTGPAKHQIVLPGFFLGDTTAEIAVVHIDGSDNRHLRMYTLAGGAWVSALEADLGRGVLFVDVANIGGRDRLITYESGRLSWFDPDSSTERALVEVAMRFSETDDGGIPHVDITRDLNGDDLDDLVIPSVDGFWVSIQSIDGSFTEPVKLGPPEPFLDEVTLDDKRRYRDVGLTALTIPWYLSRVHQMDYDRDGRGDLVFWNEDHFEVHRQDSRGLFSPAPESFTADVSFDSDGTYSLAFGSGDENPFALLFGFRKSTRRTVLHSFRDMNGDDVADLLTLTLTGRSILKQRRKMEVHFGAPTPNSISFARDAGTATRSRGKAGALQPWGYSSQELQDLDGDGRVEVMFRDIPVGLSAMFRALVGNSVPINLELFHGEDGGKDGISTNKPATTRKIRRFAPFAGLGNVFLPAVLVGDVNGDGRSDLLVGHSPKKLHVFLGVPGPDLLARQPRKVPVAMPSDERHTWLSDLNRDGKQDLLTLRGPTDYAPTEPRRLTLLIAR